MYPDLSRCDYEYESGYTSLYFCKHHLNSVVDIGQVWLLQLPHISCQYSFKKCVVVIFFSLVECEHIFLLSDGIVLSL